MNTTTAGTVQVGQHVSTIPSVASGRTTRTSGVVTEVEAFEIMGHGFADIRMGTVTLTVSTSTLVELI